MTQIAGQADINTVQAQASTITNGVNAPVSSATFTFWAGFDGTNNIASNPSFSNDTQSTAVGALYKRIKGVSIAFNFPESCHVAHALN